MGETTLLHSFGDDDDDDDDGEFTISIRCDLEYIKFVSDSWLIKIRIDDPFLRGKRPRDWFVKTIGKGKTANCTDRGWRIFSMAP